MDDLGAQFGGTPILGTAHTFINIIIIDSTIVTIIIDSTIVTIITNCYYHYYSYYYYYHSYY